MFTLQWQYTQLMLTSSWWKLLREVRFVRRMASSLSASSHLKLDATVNWLPWLNRRYSYFYYDMATLIEAVSYVWKTIGINIYFLVKFLAQLFKLSIVISNHRQTCIYISREKTHSANVFRIKQETRSRKVFEKIFFFGANYLILILYQPNRIAPQFEPVTLLIRNKLKIYSVQSGHINN